MGITTIVKLFSMATLNQRVESTGCFKQSFAGGFEDPLPQANVFKSPRLPRSSQHVWAKCIKMLSSKSATQAPQAMSATHAKYTWQLAAGPLDGFEKRELCSETWQA